jgi:nicotinamidase-related amidase
MPMRRSLARRDFSRERVPAAPRSFTSRIRGAPAVSSTAQPSGGAIVSALAPLPGEPVIEKLLPNAFAGTDLRERLVATERKNLILVGFMTHMCVSSTARAALDLGFRTTIDANGCATRDLPDGRGGAIAAAMVHDVALAELSDRFAIIARDSRELF